MAAEKSIPEAVQWESPRVSVEARALAVIGEREESCVCLDWRRVEVRRHGVKEKERERILERIG